jgi:hypothetical protein
MALRVRKPAKALIESVEEDEPKKPAAVAKSNRRKTVTGAVVLAAEKVCFHFKAVSDINRSLYFNYPRIWFPEQLDAVPDILRVQFSVRMVINLSTFVVMEGN